MTKQEFLNKISEAGREADCRELLAYYDELIDDMMENGMTEESAVAELNSQNFSFSEPEHTLTVTAGIEEQKPEKELQLTEIERRGNPVNGITITCRGETQYLAGSFDSILGDLNSLSLEVEESDSGNCELLLPDDENLDFTAAVEEGTLKLHAVFLPREPKGILKSLIKAAILTGGGTAQLYLPDNRYGNLCINSTSGDLQFNRELYANSLVFNSISGDANLQGTDAETMELKTKSGDICLEGFVNCKTLRCETLSGDVSANSEVRAEEVLTDTKSGDIAFDEVVLCGNLTASTASGDVRAENIQGQSIKLNAISGDVSAEALAADSITLRSVSGDVEATCDAANVKAKSTSGDVSLTLLRPTYCRTTSVSGGIEVTGNNQGPAQCEAASISGHVEIHCPD